MKRGTPCSRDPQGPWVGQAAFSVKEGGWVDAERRRRWVVDSGWWMMPSVVVADGDAEQHLACVRTLAPPGPSLPDLSPGGSGPLLLVFPRMPFGHRPSRPKSLLQEISRDTSPSCELPREDLLPKVLVSGVMSTGWGLQTVGRGRDTGAGPEAVVTQRAQDPRRMAQNCSVWSHSLLTPGTAPAIWAFTYFVYQPCGKPAQRPVLSPHCPKLLHKKLHFNWFSFRANERETKN